MTQVFTTRFTTDISQHKKAMAEYRQSIDANIATIRNMMSLGGIAGALGGTAGIVMLAKETLKLGADMEKTRVAFDVMLGSAEKSKKVLAELTRYADITPFETDEVIKAGRALLAANIQTTQLTDKLNLLGNIASGVGAPLQDIVLIYSKAANKGRVQAEELNQMAERGIPILDALSKTLGVTTAEVMKLGSDGKLSFALLDEALQKLGGKGGMYFGLMDKQAKTLAGLWSTLTGNVKMLGTELAELALPSFSKVVDELITKLDEMKKSGQLDAEIRSFAEAISKTVLAARDLALFLAKNKDNFIALGKVALYWTIFAKLNQMLAVTGSLLKGIDALSFASGLANLRKQSDLLKVLTADLTALHRATGTLRTSLTTLGSAAGVAFAGWEIGKVIAQMMDLEGYFTRVIAKANGLTDAQINDARNQEKAEPSVKNRDLVADMRRQKAIADEIKKLQEDSGNIKDPAQAGAKKVIDDRIRALQLESLALADETALYELNAMDDIKKRDEYQKKLKESKDNEQKIKNKINSLEKKPDGVWSEIYDVKLKPILEPVATENNKKALDAARVELRAEQDKQVALAGTFAKLDATRRDYNDNIGRLHKAEADDAVDSARKISAAEQFKLDQMNDYNKKRLELEREAAEARKKLAEDKQKLSDDQYRDSMNDKIEGWREEIKGYQKDIDATEKMLRKLGQSVDEDILKTPEQIAQAEKDDMLKTKIEAANKGQSVTFTKEEAARINEMQKAQSDARAKQKAIQGGEANIEGAEKDLKSLDKQRRQEDYDSRRKNIEQRELATARVNEQLETAKAANKPMVELLDAIKDILKKGLPTETMK